MRGTPLILSAVAAVTVALAGRAADPPAKAERLALWNKNAPQGDGTFEAADAFITLLADLHERGGPQS